MSDRKPGAPRISQDERTVTKVISILPSDLTYLASIDPSLSKAIRKLTKERKEQRP